MNKCEEFRDQILTDYVDAEMDAVTHRRLENHLAECVACRAFAQDVKTNLVKPFKTAGRVAVPEHLWTAIREKIEGEQVVHSPEKGFWERLQELFPYPQIVPVFTTLLCLVIVASLVFHVQQVNQAKEKEQGKYLVSVLVGTDAGQENEGEDIGTPIERYFL